MSDQKNADIFFQCTFGRSGWLPEQWILVRDPASEYFGGWKQHADHIENLTPPDARPEELCENRSRCKETYTSMVYNRRFCGDLTVTATLEFDDRMAPLIVLARDLGTSADGRKEHRDRIEVVAYEEGINIWRQFPTPEGRRFYLAAFARFHLRPRTRYVLTVSKRGKELTAAIDGRLMGYHEPNLPEEFFAGITGCEGVNRFYDFAVCRPA